MLPIVEPTKEEIKEAWRRYKEGLPLSDRELYIIKHYGEPEWYQDRS